MIRSALANALTACCAVLALLAWTAGSAQTVAPAKTTPTTSRPSLQPGTPAAPAKVLLVDDDESDNNSNPASGKLSASDSFYRKLLDDRSITYDTVVVPRYADGPLLDKLKGYSLVLWYTGASYVGNRDNTAVVSLRDEETLTRYLREAGGAVMLFSPGYLNNALGAGGAALWTEKKAPFLQQVLGIKGGRGLLQRFKEASVTSTGGESFAVAKSPTVEIQFSAINPDQAKTLFTAALDPDGKGARAVPVATSNAVGAGRIAYVAFSFENIANDAGKAFTQMLLAVGTQTTAESRSAAPASSAAANYPLRATTAQLTVTGTGRLSDAPPFEPLRAQTASMSVTGTGSLNAGPPFEPVRARTATITVTGTGSLQ